MQKIRWIEARLLTRDWRPMRAAAVGLLATLAYSVAMEGDKILLGNRFSDVRFIEGLITSDQDKQGSPRVRALAWALHLLNGVALAELYAAIVKRFLPGPGWLRGALFGELFITGAWCLVPLADKYHPLIKNGEMPPLANWKSFGQNLLRHLVFGLVLGWLYK
jgi:hypothetical protein